MSITYARIRNRQRKEAIKPVTFQPVNWEPQVEVTMTRDVNGYHDKDNNIKWHFAAGQTVHVPEQVAVEWIVKGYARGELPRHVSEDEAEEIRSVMTTIGMGEPPGRA